MTVCLLQAYNCFFLILQPLNYKVHACSQIITPTHYHENIVQLCVFSPYRKLPLQIALSDPNIKEGEELGYLKISLCVSSISSNDKEPEEVQSQQQQQQVKQQPPVPVSEVVEHKPRYVMIIITRLINSIATSWL